MLARVWFEIDINKLSDERYVEGTGLGYGYGYGYLVLVSRTPEEG